MKIQLYRSYPSSCSYIENLQSTNVVVDPELETTAKQYEMLLQGGFRRSGSMVYRPQCEACNACVPCRVPIGWFAPRRSQKRCLKKNSDLIIKREDPRYTDEYFALYENYLTDKHRGSGMEHPTPQSFIDFLCQRQELSCFLEMRDATGKLLCVACTDQLPNSLSAVYTWYDPDEDHRSLGVFAILQQINYAKSLGLDYLYLGYWIENVRKMSYKTEYRPFELLSESGWTLSS